MSEHHGHTRVGLTASAGNKAHFAPGCSHAPCLHAMCGTETNGEWIVNDFDGPSLCAACTAILGKTAIVPVAPSTVIRELGIVNYEDPLGSTLEGIVQEHVPALDAESLGALGTVSGRFTSSQVHLDPSCNQPKEGSEEFIPYYMDQGKMVIPGWDVHCQSGLSASAENAAMGSIVLRQAKETLESMAAEGGWGAYRTAQNVMEGRILGLPATLTPATRSAPRVGNLRQANENIQRAWSLSLRAIDRWLESTDARLEANTVALFHEMVGGRAWGLGVPLEGIGFIESEVAALATLDRDGLLTSNANVAHTVNKIITYSGMDVADGDLATVFYQDAVDYSHTLRRSARAFGEGIIQGQVRGVVARVPDDSAGWHRDLATQWPHGEIVGNSLDAWIPGLLSVSLNRNVNISVAKGQHVPLVSYTKGRYHFSSSRTPTTGVRQKLR